MSGSRSRRGRIAVLAGAACLCLGTAACSTCDDSFARYSREEGDRALIEVGKHYYDTKCASCHGMTARGGGPAAGALKVAPPDLTRAAARREGRYDIDELSQFIDGRTMRRSHGSAEMPIWGGLFARESGGATTGDEIARGRIVSLLEYLRTLQRE